MASEEPVAIFKKSSKSRSSLRSKQPSLPSSSTSATNTRTRDSDGEESDPGVVTKKRKLGPTALSASTTSKRRKNGRQREEESDDEDTEVVGGDLAVRYTVSKNLAFSNPALARSRSPSPSALAAGASEEGGRAEFRVVYRSKNAKHQLPTGGGRFGPQKEGPGNVRTITLVDYQPDVCKDYKETGFCGYGDSCKFLHDRGDYLRGWEMDNQYLSNPSFTSSSNPQRADTPEEEEVPFACLLCRKPFTSPVVTRCGHYYCQSCAIDRFRKTPRCFACGTNTGGVFNKAEKVLEAMKRRNERRGVGGGDGEGENAGELEGVEGLQEEEEE
ncbi:hypothetical protein BT69DRAFT_1309262 [Atractiella rhizophila]|nr:hypothetical protein BT69DRAFT_1309262 [Atractiella rhizophila]